MGSSCSIDQLPIPGRRGDFPSFKILIEAHKRGLDRNKYNLVGRLDLMKIKITEVRKIAITLWKSKGVCRIVPVASKEGVASTSSGTGVNANSSAGTYTYITAQLIRETSLVLVNKEDNWADMVDDEEMDEACVAKSTSQCKTNAKKVVHASSFKIVRRGLWKELVTISRLNLPWLAVGDFNIIRLLSERFRGTCPTLSAIKEFNDYLDDCELLESFTTGMKLTWCNGQSGCTRILRRLDSALFNNLWAGKFDGWKVKALARENSDHSALVGGPNSIPKPTNIPFRFLKCWIEIPDFQDLVKTTWEVPQDGNPLIKLMKSCKDLK
ncbi:hypothetical protein GIB67_008063 [Kingdonia uniflora]|uniref:Uncharacterized protein n=1 Tax=Kingdonia uniflora TaxID=39325 RepID=A0A7J7MN30_9MAGN|nr:hypothetical protein GIB67_008063 [Kingdonia uniflora]